MKKQVLILGAGPAGLAAAEAAAAHGAQATLCGAEQYPPYFRPRLTRYLSEPSAADRMAIRKPEWYAEKGIGLKTGTVADFIDVPQKTVRFSDGSLLQWDSLVLAMGASPNRLPLPCKEPAMTLRSYDDAVAVRQLALARGRAVIVGGGLLGLEVAWELNGAGVNTAVVERAPWLMPRQLNEAAGIHLQRRLEASGLSLTIATDPTTLSACYEGACVVLCAGVQANLALVQGTGIAAGRSVTVDDHMGTNLEGIYACGDVAEFNGRNWGLIAVAQEQGEIAGANAAGSNAVYIETPPSPMLKVGAHGVFSVGDITEGEGIVSLSEESEAGYACLMVRDGVLVGAVLVGDTKAGMKLKKAVADRISLAGAKSYPEAMQGI